MRRLDLGFKIFPDLCASEIIDSNCPYDVDKQLPNLNIDDYRFETECVEKGCRGITCDECWRKDLEFESVKSTT